MSEVNVKTNRIGRTKWTSHKEQSSASNYFIFLKILFQFKRRPSIKYVCSKREGGGQSKTEHLLFLRHHSIV